MMDIGPVYQPQVNYREGNNEAEKGRYQKVQLSACTFDSITQQSVFRLHLACHITVRRRTPHGEMNGGQMYRCILSNS